MMASKAQSVYRHFMRSLKIAFKDDDFMHQAARGELRRRIQELSDVTDPGTLEKLYSEGHDAADFLTQNVVQAELNDRGNYTMSVEPRHTGGIAEEAALRPDRPPS